MFSEKKNSAILGLLQSTDTAISACSTEFREDSGLKTGSANGQVLSACLQDDTVAPRCSAATN